MSALNSPARQRGVTLIELMIVVVIIAILASVGYPSYTDFITRSNRQAGKNMIYAIADRQEQFFLDNKQYAPNMTTLGFAANTIGVDRDGLQTSAADADRTYVLDLTNTSATTYTVRAVPQLKQAARDADCGTLSVTHLGQRDASGGGANCW